MQLAVANGTVTVSLAGGGDDQRGANGSATLTLSGTQAQINAALASVSYQGKLDFIGPDTLTVTSTDSNSVTDVDTVAITVSCGERCAGEHGAGRADRERGYRARDQRGERQ